MREIKFRYKYEGPDGSFFFQTFTLDEIEGGDQFDAISDMPLFKNHRITRREQFTGLHDKNDKEIYEGDRIRADGMTYTVEFKEGSFIYGDTCYPASLWRVVENCEIIGNIHENPELLEGKP